MPADQKDRYIQYLLGKVNELDLDKRAMELAVEEFQGVHNNVLEQLAELQRSRAEVKTELHEERGKRKRAEAKARKLDQQLKYAKKNKFGNKRQNARKESDSKEDVDRKDEKDRFDGTDGTASTKSVQEHPAEDCPVKEKKERDMSNRPEKYDTMSVKGTPVFFAYQKDGNYPIDNNIAERTIRKHTTQRNNSLHYGSDEGVEMAVAYYSVISTVKLHGMSCWDYLGKFFKKTVQTNEKKTCFQFSECSLSYANIFNGCRDFFSLTPANIGMAYAKYRANEYKADIQRLTVKSKA